jgi:deoxyguanosine kinase
MASMAKQFYIGFEGPIAAGKTTVARLLAKHMDAKLVLEDVDGNEFLPDFYAVPDRWSLSMQLWFLTARHQQLSAVTAERDGNVVADYTYAKDGIFARTLLKGRDLRLYNRIAAGLRSLPQPDLLVYLDADDEVLVDRIARRGRPYEKSITPAYLDSVRSAYERYLESGAEPNVFRFNTGNLDLTSDAQLTDLYSQILLRCRARNRPPRMRIK